MTYRSLTLRKRLFRPQPAMLTLYGDYLLNREVSGIADVPFPAGETIPPSECFVERFALIHEYRRLPFFDPDLPEKLLPDNWLRPRAAALFHQYHDLLADKANEYFDTVLREY